MDRGLATLALDRDRWISQFH